MAGSLADRINFERKERVKRLKKKGKKAKSEHKGKKSKTRGIKDTISSIAKNLGF